MLGYTNEIAGRDIATELLVVKIVNPYFRYDQFDYIIYSNDNKVLRKGSFRAPVVQLRTIDMNEGTCHIRLLRNGQEWKTRDVEKQKDQTFKNKKSGNTVYFL